MGTIRLVRKIGVGRLLYKETAVLTGANDTQVLRFSWRENGGSPPPPNISADIYRLNSEFFYVFLAVHHSIDFSKYQLNAQFF